MKQTPFPWNFWVIACAFIGILWARSAQDEWVSLFDGESFQGWEGNLRYFRVEDQALIGGFLHASIPRNQFLATEKEYADFELQLQFKLKGKKTNAGIQLRSQRIPNHHEVIGYQADLGEQYTGCLYDESRRNKVLAGPKADEMAAVIQPDAWNDYRIRCRGRRIELWINGHLTVDYTESDPSIPQHGIIALQIHGGPPGEVGYRRIRIREL